MCHMGQEFMLSGALQHGTCTIQATAQGFSSAEFMDMVTRCGLNRINQFPSFLTVHLKASRHNPKLLAMLKGLDEIFYSGMPLSQEDEEWVHRHSINVVHKLLWTHTIHIRRFSRAKVAYTRFRRGDRVSRNRLSSPTGRGSHRMNKE